MSGDDDTVKLETEASQALAEIAPSGSPVGSYLVWAATQQPHWLYAVASVFSAAAYELAQRSFHLRQENYPMGLWFALAGDSASGKSTAMRQARQFVEDAWAEAHVGHPTSPWVETEGSVAGILAALAGHYDAHRRTTVAMMFHHELSAVLNTREPIGEMLCRLADGHTYERNLRELQKGAKGRGTVDGSGRIERPVISGIFASTEVALSRVFNEAHRAGGLFSRFCWINPPFSPAHARFVSDLKPAEHPQYRAAVDVWSGWLGNLGLLDTEVSLSPEAEDVLLDFFEGQKRRISEHDPMNGPRLRLVEKARVFAAIHAVGRCCAVVSASDMIYACNLADVLVAHAEGLSHLGSDPIVRKVQRAQELVDNAGDIGISRRVLYERLAVSRRVMDEVVSTLIDSGRAVETKARGSSNSILVSTATERGQQLLKHEDLLIRVGSDTDDDSSREGGTGK